MAISSIEVIADAAELREAPMHPELVRLVRNLANVPRNRKFAVLQAGTMSLAPLVTGGLLDYHDVLDRLVRVSVDQHGLPQDDVEHVVGGSADSMLASKARRLRQA